MNGHQRPAPGTAENLRDRFEEVAPVIVIDPGPVVRRGRRRRATARAATGLGVVAVVLAVVLLARPGDGTTGPVASTRPPPEPSRPVAVEVVPGVVAPGDVVTAVLVASEANELTFGVAAEVDRWDGDEWVRAGFAALCLVEWECVGSVTDRLGAVEGIGLGATPDAPGIATLLGTDGLDEGWYRLVQRSALDEDVATGVFEVRRGASTAPPLPAQDADRLSVEPRLVPPEGGLVRVVPQVPAGDDGTLTAEDVEAVDAALDPTALVQRWDGDRWRDVAEAPVQEREAELGVEWGAPVTLPRLDEGSYRVLRERAGGEALWGVFTVVAGAPRLAQPDTGLDPGADGRPPVP